MAGELHGIVPRCVAFLLISLLVLDCIAADDVTASELSGNHGFSSEYADEVVSESDDVGDHGFSSESADEEVSVSDDVSDRGFSNSTPNGVRREGVDTALCKYAFMRLASHAKTGVIYNITLPPSLQPGLSAQVMRVRSGSAHRRGLAFNEFNIPKGFIVVTGGPFVVMVYRKASDFTLYSLPQGYQFLSPVVGIVTYTSPNTSFDSSDLPEMNVVSPTSPINATLPLYQPGNVSSNSGFNSDSGFAMRPLCAFFDINGTVSFGNVSSPPNLCSIHTLLDVALVMPTSQWEPTSIAPAPAASSSPPLLSSSAHKSSSSNAWKFALVAILGGVVGMCVLATSLVLGSRARNRTVLKLLNQEPASSSYFNNHHEALQTSFIGHTRAPTAAGVRTKPSLETGAVRLDGRTLTSPFNLPHHAIGTHSSSSSSI